MLKRALISVSDKTGVIEFARKLSTLGIELLSTGGTAKALLEASIPVQDVSDYTGFPEIMQGRVKTLHPKVHGGILGRRGTDDDIMQELEIPPIDLVVVNLYPFIQSPSIENIDIGGPTMVRAAAKNYEHVAVVVNPSDYDEITSALEQHKAISKELRFELAKKAFAHTAQYDCAISNYFEAQKLDSEMLPERVSMQLQKVQNLRYGENPHQRGGLYEINGQAYGFTALKQHQGKPLSYNNLADADAAITCVKAFQERPACVIVKHANPCGVAIASTPLEAYNKAYECDTTSAFGGIIAFNNSLDEKTATKILENQFVEVIIAPDFAPQALKALEQKPTIRVLAYPIDTKNMPWHLHCIEGGILLQDTDDANPTQPNIKVVSKAQPDDQTWQDCLFALRVVKHVKSNAIVYTKNGQTLGIGPGQTARVTSAEIAISKANAAGLSLAGSVMASDAFFPFRDSIDAAAKAGIKTIIQPGGSKRDDEVIAAADEHQMVMLFTGIRHFKH